VAQITIYVPDTVARKLRRDARKAKKSLSSYLTDLAAGESRSRTWPRWFFELEGSCRGSLAIPEDPPPEEPDAL
jgi:hypothetical protein